MRKFVKFKALALLVFFVVAAMAVVMGAMVGVVAAAV